HAGFDRAHSRYDPHKARHPQDPKVPRPAHFHAQVTRKTGFTSGIIVSTDLPKARHRRPSAPIVSHLQHPYFDF
ncbi:hypothetical protein ACC736_37630, partial [Rhizobium ruizarguesonis]